MEVLANRYKHQYYKQPLTDSTVNNLTNLNDFFCPSHNANGIEYLPLTSLRKLRLPANGNLKKTENTFNETNVLFLPLKLTASRNFYFVTVGTNR